MYSGSITHIEFEGMGTAVSKSLPFQWCDEIWANRTTAQRTVVSIALALFAIIGVTYLICYSADIDPFEMQEGIKWLHDNQAAAISVSAGLVIIFLFWCKKSERENKPLLAQPLTSSLPSEPPLTSLAVSLTTTLPSASNNTGAGALPLPQATSAQAALVSSSSPPEAPLSHSLASEPHTAAPHPPAHSSSQAPPALALPLGATQVVLGAGASVYADASAAAAPRPVHLSPPPAPAKQASIIGPPASSAAGSAAAPGISVPPSATASSSSISSGRIIARKMLSFPEGLVNPTATHLGNGKHRWVERLDNTSIVFKRAYRWGEVYMTLEAIEQEYRAYEVSEILGLHAVPKLTYYDPLEADRVREQYPGLPLGKGDLLLQELASLSKVGEGMSDPLHRALFFNWIIGRGDNKKENSASGLEIDNEIIGGYPNGRRHWSIGSALIPEETLQKIRDLPDRIVLQREPFVNPLYKPERVKRLEDIIERNLAIVKKAIPASGTISSHDLDVEISRLSTIAQEAAAKAATA